jgi:hypothetical protein
MSLTHANEILKLYQPVERYFPGLQYLFGIGQALQLQSGRSAHALLRSASTNNAMPCMIRSMLLRQHVRACSAHACLVVVKLLLDVPDDGGPLDAWKLHRRFQDVPIQPRYIDVLSCHHA